MENPEKKLARTDLWERRRNHGGKEEEHLGYWHQRDKKPNSRMTQRYIQNEEKKEDISERR